MRHNIGKPAALVIALSFLLITGCASREAAHTDNDVSVSDNKSEEEDAVIDSSDEDIDVSIEETDTYSSIYDEIDGTYYSEETVSDELTGETVPKSCGLISGYEIQFYEYDQNVHCYRMSKKRSISETERKAGGNLIEFHHDSCKGCRQRRQRQIL